ncbi:MAG: AMP-binding protein [Candidatus Nezhaarchaeales archaeon]
MSTLKDLSRLPFTTRQDLLSSYPYGTLAVDLNDVVLVLSSSGTTGKPVLTFYTERDYKLWMERLVRNLKLIGIGKGDIFINTSNQGMFTGRGYSEAASLAGAASIPIGPASPDKHLRFMIDLGATSFHAIPSFALKMANLAKDAGLTEKLKLRKAVIGAETWNESTRRRIEESLNVDAYDNYGVAELGGPGVAIECSEKDGLHVWADHYLIEVVDVKTGERVCEGEEGGLVVTTLTREAMPLIRYRTGDIVKLLPSECSCGLKTPKISRIKGRVDEMVKVRGISLYPKIIEEVVSSMPELTGEYQIELSNIDDITVIVEVKKWVREVDELVNELKRRIKELTLLNVAIKLVDEGKIEHQGKAKRVLDLRRL